MERKELDTALKGIAALPSDPAKFTSKDMLLFELAQALIKQGTGETEEFGYCGTGAYSDPDYITPRMVRYLMERGSLLTEPEYGAQSNMQAAHTLKGMRGLSRKDARRMFRHEWELPRARSNGEVMLSDKYAVGALWSPEAAKKALTSKGMITASRVKGGKLLLEHAVPFININEIFLEVVQEDVELGVHFLQTYVTHVIITGIDEDAKLRPGLNDEEHQLMREHALGRISLSEWEIYCLRFGRYMEAQSRGLELRDFRSMYDFRNERFGKKAYVGIQG